MCLADYTKIRPGLKELYGFINKGYEDYDWSNDWQFLKGG